MSESQQQEPRILKIAECMSLSGRTGITYHVGCMGANDVCFRIWDTSGKGVFSKEWVPASEIQKVLSKDDLLSAPSLLPIFKVGRSVNTGGYLLAVLKQEGLVVLSPDTPHKYVRQKSEKFVAEVAELIKKAVSLDPVKDAPAASINGKAKKRRGAAAAPWDGQTQDAKPQGE